MKNWTANVMTEELPVQAVQNPATAPKKASIDDVLAWAYRQELPKSDEGFARSESRADAAFDEGAVDAFWQRSQDSVLSRLGELGVLVDVSPNVHGVIPSFALDAEPHPDALIVSRAVRALDDLAFRQLAGVDMLGEPAFDVLTDAERIAAHDEGAERALDKHGRPRSRLSVGVISAAVLGRFRPAPMIEEVRRVPMTRHGRPVWFRQIPGANGVMIEVDGYNARRQRPHPGAYRKTMLDLRPSLIVAERIDYQAWRLALDTLAGDLAGQLATFEVGQSREPHWPWEGQRTLSTGRILPALRPAEAVSAPVLLKTKKRKACAA